MGQLMHVNILVDDIDRATEFYGGFLGLESFDPGGFDFKARFFKINETQELHVNELPDVKMVRGHFAMSVDNFEDVFERAVEAGILDTETWCPPRRLPNGAMQLFIRDPDTNLVEIGTTPNYDIADSFFDHELVESQ